METEPDKFVMDKETDLRIKKYVESCFQKYMSYKQKNQAKVDQWLLSSQDDSPKNS